MWEYMWVLRGLRREKALWKLLLTGEMNAGNGGQKHVTHEWLLEDAAVIDMHVSAGICGEGLEWGGSRWSSPRLMQYL